MTLGRAKPDDPSGGGPAGSATLDADPAQLAHVAELEAAFGAPSTSQDPRDVPAEAPAPLRAIEKRECVYRRLLAFADAAGAFATLVVLALEAGRSFHPGFLLAPVAAVLAAEAEGLYDRDEMMIRKHTTGEWRAVLRCTALAGIVTYLVWTHTAADPNPRGIHIFAFIIVVAFAFTLPLRAIARRIARAVTSDERCLIVGVPDQCAALASKLTSIPGIELLGVVANSDVDCSVAGLREIVEELRVERIVIGPHPAWREQSTLHLIRSAKWLGIRVSLMPSVLEVVGATTRVDAIDSIVLLGVPRFGLSRSSELLKRGLDLFLASVLVLLAAPLLIAIAVAVRLDSPGPVLFRQRRIGRQGKSFTMYKFRSMVERAELLRPEMDGNNETVGLFKLANDPRVTRVGRFLRSGYLDELPQLFNVLHGEMSLVGPRPLIEAEDRLLTGHERHRSRLTPGMTGPWQLRGPLNASLSELIKLDYMYASNWTVWEDIDIILGTASRVLRRAGH